MMETSNVLLVGLSSLNIFRHLIFVSILSWNSLRLVASAEGACVFKIAFMYAATSISGLPYLFCNSSMA